MYKRKEEDKKRLKKLYEQTKGSYGVGAYFDKEKERLVKFSINSKDLRTSLNRKFRRNKNYEETPTSDGGYKKHQDYWWELC